MQNRSHPSPILKSFLIEMANSKSLNSFKHESDDFQKFRSVSSNYSFNRMYWWRNIQIMKSILIVTLIAVAALCLRRKIYLSRHSKIQMLSQIAVIDPPWGGVRWENKIKKSCQTNGGLRVLVTGAAGFVGSHVALQLKNRGDGVVGIDNFNAYYPVALKRARQANLMKAGIFIIDGDINNQPLLARIFELVQFTHVLHLAAQAGVRYAVHNPMAYVHSNIAGFVSLLEECKKANPQPIIVFASSSSVYGLNTKVPFNEDDATDQPASLYAATKKSDEVIGHTYNHIYGLSVTALRFFTVYGPWGRPDMAYFSFTRNILEGLPIRIFQGPMGEELARDFTYIDDVAHGCISALDTASPSTGGMGKRRKKAQFRTFNLGNTQPVKVGTFVSILEKHLKVKAVRKYILMPSTGDVLFTHANVSRANRDLGYNPTTDLDTGLKKFVKWYKSYYKEGGGHEDSLNGYKPF